MQDQFLIPSCFSPAGKFSDDRTSVAAMPGTRAGQSIVMLVYRTKIAGFCRLITVTWCKNLLVHRLSVSVESPETDTDETSHDRSHSVHPPSCKVELRPWYFWRKHGAKRFHVNGKPVDVFWDLRGAKFSGQTEPRSDYYVAVVSDGEVALLLGDQKKEAYRRIGLRPAAINAILMSKKEHVFGKKTFATRGKFHDRGKLHEILIELNLGKGGSEPEMLIKVDGNEVVNVKHLQWKFRGNEAVSVYRARMEVYWDVHDWLFTPGPRHALFIFRPVSSPPSSSSSTSSSSSLSSLSSVGAGSGGPCLFLYAWKLE